MKGQRGRPQSEQTLEPSARLVKAPSVGVVECAGVCECGCASECKCESGKCG